ncbi:MAG TPA: hypothetical protein VGQ76_15410 [Thermoanaerobaculia bacterium]|jgi:hypothetical protein|nr:hypothetical protein [Thermoanaerobaculia bacterium]
MTKLADDRSIIAIDPNPRGLAFVFFENGMLLDWGTRRGDGDECALLQRLLERYKADVLVLEDPEVPRAERRPRVRQLLGLLAQTARHQGVRVVAVSRFAVRREWAERGLTRKHAVAESIGAMFPEIEPLVPRKRKVFRSEEARTEIFDAASLVLHAFGVVPG